MAQSVEQTTLAQILARHAEDVLHRLNSSPDSQNKAEPDQLRRIYNLSIPHLAVLLSNRKDRFIVVEDTPEHAEMLYSDILYTASICKPEKSVQGLKSEISNLKSQISYFPPALSPELIGERARTVRNLASGNVTGIITSIEAIHTGLAAEGPKSAYTISKGLSVDRELMDMMLRDLGYRKVDIVMEKGEYAERGWIFDIFPVTEDLPVRAEFFGDEIDMIRNFDIETQRSIKKIKELAIFPADENLPEVEEDRIDFENSVMKLLPQAEVFINRKIEPANIDEMTNIHKSDESFSSVIPACPESFLKKDSRRAPLAGMTNTLMSNTKITIFSHFAFAGEGIDAKEIPIAGLGILPEERRSADDIATALSASKKKTVIVLPSSAQIERLKSIISENGVVSPVIENKNVCSYEGSLCLTQGRLSAGLNLHDILLLTGREIFGEMPAYRPIRKSKVSRLLLTLDDLKPGDFVVHKDHGIGKFIGLQHEKIEDYEEDLITLEYSGGDRLYLPFQSIHLLRKYSAGEGHVPALDRIGGKRWQSTKLKVKKSVKEMAEKLLKLYAERRVSRGFVFSSDTPMHSEFDDFFPYEETEDQIKAVEAIKKHMQSDQPMDMLICGDVGYGKTEVAIRAAFRAVYDGKQVAVLVPTTLLAEQHYRTFRSRFAAFPVKIDYLDRFKDSKEAKKSVTALGTGELDIIIGTHMLLNKKVHFQDLGLLIIDEEHKFGVVQKERMIELKKGVDCITLTATPIPRTLHMSLSGIREMETIESPPEERLAVRSVVTRRDDKVIREALERELKREGQVFFVHNRIRDIEKVVAYVRKLAPDARTAYAHGQMHEHQLEKIMLAFLNKEIDILVSTAIIGAGIDVPTANTIIIDRADTFGLSDLYQLRGRVGRGNVQAYAYFLIPGEDIMTEDAKKRLQAIQEMSYLGAGFRLALRDLEIRGAGNLLGGEQSGHIFKVGFDMYMDMLEKAVAELKGEKVREEIEPQIKLRLAAFIPEEYISDMALRLNMYKRLTSIKRIDELHDLSDEMTDRFGPAPEEVKNLLHVIRIKIFAKGLFITKVADVDGRYRFNIGKDETGREYKLPEGFAEKMLEVLMEMQRNSGGVLSGKGGSRNIPAKERNALTIRLLQNGFELATNGKHSEETMKALENTLKELTEKIG